MLSLLLKGKDFNIIYGVILTISIAIIAYFLSTFITIGSVALAIILGIVISNIVPLHNKFEHGITYSEKTILAFAIALMGINLDFTILFNLGIKAVILIILGMALTIFSTLFLAKFFKINTKFALLLGIGNAVCGASAIGATKDIVKADESEVGISVAIVNFLGTIGMFLVPFIALTLGFNDTNSGILVGDTLQAVGQAVAGGFSISDIAGQSATIVKMGRVLMLTPLIVILLWIYSTNNAPEEKRSVKSILKNIPLFIIGFIVFSIISTFQILPENIVHYISILSEFTLIIAMAGIGLKISFKSIKNNGKNALILATIIAMIQIIFASLFIIFIF